MQLPEGSSMAGPRPDPSGSPRRPSAAPGVPDVTATGATTAPSKVGQQTECGEVGVRHVLVPLDGSALAQGALPWAVAVSRALGARLTLLRVLENPAISCASSHHHDAVDWEMRRAEARVQLDRVDRDLKARGLTSAAELSEGRPAERIIEYARARHVDLVVLTSHGEGGLTGWALSSTALMVVAGAHGSLLVIPARPADSHGAGELRLRRILVPLDCSPRAECVLPLATALARAHGAELVLAHVVPEPEIPRRLPAAAEDLTAASQVTELNRREAGRYLGELRERLSGSGLHVSTRLVVSARRAQAIRTLAEETDVDLVVVCAHGQTADARDRYGNVAARLLERTARPLLVFQDLGPCHEPTATEAAARNRPGH